MQFNPSKCQVIHITRSRSPLPTTYTLHGETLEAVASARYLGVDIANDLSWKTHVSRITNNANKSLGFLMRNHKTKNTSLRENAYKAIVRPQLEYASPVWDPHTKDDIQKNESVQRRAARWVLGDYSPYSSVTDMIGKLGWRTLEQQRTDSRTDPLLQDHIWLCSHTSPYICHTTPTCFPYLTPIGLQTNIHQDRLL